MEEIQVQVETREQGRFYEKACEYIKPTDAPLEIVEDDGVRFKTLFMNKAYKEQIFNDNPDLIEADRRIYEIPSPLLRKYREFADKIEKSGEEETFYYTGANSYLRFQAQAISEYEGRYLLKGSLINLSMDQEREKIEELDIRLRELNQMFEVVSVIDLNKNRFTPLLGDNKFFSDYGSDELGLQDKAFTHLADIMNRGNLAKGYKLYFKSTAFSNNDDDTEETVSKELDTLFAEVADFEEQVSEKWNS